MKRALTVLAFVLLIAAGAVSASALAGKGPASVQQTVSTSTTGSTTTGTTTTGTTTTGTTATTTTISTTTTTATTTTTPAPRKITICHHVFRAKSTKHVTIRISRSAWPAHQRHGDSIGACNTASAKKFHSRKAHIKRFHHGRHGK